VAGPLGRLMLDRSAVGRLLSLSVEQNGSDCRQAIHYTYLTIPVDSLLPALAYLTYLLDQNLDLQLHNYTRYVCSWRSRFWSKRYVK